VQSNNPKLRAIAVRALAHTPEAYTSIEAKLTNAIKDANGSVRLEAISTLSQLNQQINGAAILANLPDDSISSDKQLAPIVKIVKAVTNEQVIVEKEEKIQAPKHLKAEHAKLYLLGHEVYHREAHCATCHQEDGKGLPAAMFPPLDQTKWVQGSPERLIKLTMHGLHGPINVKGKQYPGQVPMTAFKALNDKEIAGVLTYVRNNFGNNAPAISPELVTKLRKETADKESFYSPEELLKEYPHPTQK